MFVEKYGNLSETSFLFQEYCDSFYEWYGDPTVEDLLGETGYPVTDFKVWFESRLTTSSDERNGWDPEISQNHLDEEIERIRESKTKRN